MAFLSSGGGHGNYFVAKCLFPFTMLSTTVFESITGPFVLLAFVQFPIYGWFIGSSFLPGTRRLNLWLPIAFHLVALALVLLIRNPNFS